MSSKIQEVISKTLKLLISGHGAATISFDEIDALLKKHDVPIENFFSEAAIIASRNEDVTEQRSIRSQWTFKISSRKKEELTYAADKDCSYCLDANLVRKSLMSTNKAIELVHDLSALYGIDFFQILGLRNLSAFVGEVFGREVYRCYKDYFIVNPNQDGYPDLCAMTKNGIHYKEANTDATGRLKCDKSIWSPYPFGGIEIKATCGNTPPASKVRKPLIGDSRLPILVSAEWKAHHQQTEVLLGIYWDFVDRLPTVLAVFFRNDLDFSEGRSNVDWGAIVHPKKGGGRTTSVSIMKKNGVKKMGQGWLVLPNEDLMLTRLNSVFKFE